MVKYFNIGGKERPVLWNVYSLARWEKEIEKDLGSWSAEFVRGKILYMDMIKMVRIALLEGALELAENSKQDRNKQAELLTVTDRHVAMWMEESREVFGEITQYCISNMPFAQGDDKGNPQSPAQEKPGQQT
ncbi:MAG: hypothetical protein JRJ57_00195 [Deltaproteobacteria bacterium]|nr:hypothetical protein [Deltaproteobacteria bacterium]